MTGTRASFCTLSTTATAARHDDVDELGHARQHVTHRRAIGRRHDLNRRFGQAGGPQTGGQTFVNGFDGAIALAAAAKDHRVARLQTKRTGIGRDVGATLINDPDDAERHSHALDLQTVRPGPAGDDAADRVRQSDDVLDAASHGLDALLVQYQTVQQRRGNATLFGLLDIGSVGGEQVSATLANRGGRSLQRGVLGFGRCLSQGLGGALGGAAETLHRLGNRGGVAFDLQIGSVHEFILAAPRPGKEVSIGP
jgi:hypothetical protein